MALSLSFYPHELQFKFEAGTSRGVLTEKTTWIIEIVDTDHTAVKGRGEAGPLKGLSVDDRPDFKSCLEKVQLAFNEKQYSLSTGSIDQILNEVVTVDLPSVRFAIESALLDLQNGGVGIYYPTNFTLGKKGISMNGLIWMGEPEFMIKQIGEKLEAGYTTLKMKIGAIDFEKEIEILSTIRSQFSPEEITLRVDANGAFTESDVYEKLRRLSELSIHSIEQPIKAGQWEFMKSLCEASPLPIALDEELIGINGRNAKARLLETILPPMIILKPTLLGGFSETKEWIELAEERGIEWWITSALESNIGLSAVAQFTALFDNLLPQGLGTGQLYWNNFPSPLFIEKGSLYFKPN